MTKAELLFIANDVSLMDKLNCISGLLEMNKPEDKPLIDAFVDDIYSVLKENPPIVNKGNNKKYMLDEIAKVDPEKAERLKNRKMIDIRYCFNKLTKNEN